MKNILVSALGICLLLNGCKPTTTIKSDSAPAPALSSAAPPQPPAPTYDASNLEPRGRHHGPATASTPGVFNFYLFTLSWSPEFCLTHAQDAECSLHLGFTVHGLWPQNNNGSYPENCGNQPGPTNPASWSDIMPDPSLVAHEWKTHGTCSGLSADAYFGQIRKAFHEVVIPPELTVVPAGTMLTPAVLIGDVAKVNPTFPKGSIALSCGNNRLTALEVCLSKTLQPIACSGVRSCSANIVKITPRTVGK